MARRARSLAPPCSSRPCRPGWTTGGTSDEGGLRLHVRADRPRRLVRLGGVALRGPEVAALLRGAALAHEDVAELGGRAQRAARRRRPPANLLRARGVPAAPDGPSEHPHPGPRRRA